MRKSTVVYERDLKKKFGNELKTIAILLKIVYNIRVYALRLSRMKKSSKVITQKVKKND